MKGHTLDNPISMRHLTVVSIIEWNGDSQGVNVETGNQSPMRTLLQLDEMKHTDPQSELKTTKAMHFTLRIFHDNTKVKNIVKNC